MEEVPCKLEKDIEAHSLGRWTSTWKSRGVGACTACLGAALWWEVTLGSEQAQAGEPRMLGLRHSSRVSS